jgi:hypothetical protein
MYPVIYGISLPTSMMGTFFQMSRGMGTPTPALGHVAAPAATPLRPVATGLGGLGSGLNPAMAAAMGRANVLGPLSVPQSWTAAAAGPAPMLGGVPLASPVATPLAAADSGVGPGFGAPMMFGGLPQVAGGGGTPAAKYAPRLAVVPRSPAAGYAPVPESPPTPVPVAVGAAASAPAGYQPAIVYVPANGHTPALV